MANSEILLQSQTAFYMLGVFFLLSFQLLCWMPNPPWTSGEASGHRGNMPGRQHIAQLCKMSASTCCCGTAGDQNTKTQGRKEKQSCLDLPGHKYPGGSPQVSASEHRKAMPCSIASHRQEGI